MTRAVIISTLLTMLVIFSVSQSASLACLLPHVPIQHFALRSERKLMLQPTLFLAEPSTPKSITSPPPLALPCHLNPNPNPTPLHGRHLGFPPAPPIPGVGVCSPTTLFTPLNPIAVPDLGVLVP